MEKINENMLNEISELFVSVFNKAPWYDSWTKEQALERLTDIFHTPKFDGMVEKREGKIIAAALGRGETYFDGVHFQILEFFVDDKLQGQGIGTHFIKEFVSYLENKDIRACFLLTGHGPATEGFYQKNGFVTDDYMCLMHN